MAPWFGLRFWLDRSEQAAAGLGDYRLRTTLSILGIAIGIAAVMAIAAVSRSGYELIFRELETFGLKSVWIYRDYNDKDPNRAVRSGSGISNEDFALIQAGGCPSVSLATPIVYAGETRQIVRSGNRYSNAALIGVGVHYATINNDRIVAGRAFRDDEIEAARGAAILGITVAEDLFGSAQDIVGRDFQIGAQRFRVIGLLERKSRDFLASIGTVRGQDVNNRILVPYTALQQINGRKDIHTVQVEAESLEAGEAAANQIITLLRRQNADRFSYRSETMSQYVGTANRILYGVSFVGIVAASISLLVGGLGIMNIVSTSVLERTREIGIRKAVGASPTDIEIQFLMESVIISILGGLLGLVVGTAASEVLTRVTGVPLLPTWEVVVAALLVSFLVGLFSGYLPARRASRLNPVYALRYE